MKLRPTILLSVESEIERLETIANRIADKPALNDLEQQFADLLLNAAGELTLRLILAKEYQTV